MKAVFFSPYDETEAVHDKLTFWVWVLWKPTQYLGSRMKVNTNLPKLWRQHCFFPVFYMAQQLQDNRSTWALLIDLTHLLKPEDLVPLHRNQSTNLKRYMHPDVHCSIIYNSQDMEATWVSTYGWMDIKKMCFFIQQNIVQPLKMKSCPLWQCGWT